MQTTPTAPAPAPGWQQAATTQAVHLRNQINGGLSWFPTIAGLTLLNSLLLRSGLQLTFVVGLTAGQLVDGFSTALADEFGGDVGLAVNVVGFAIGLVLAAACLLPWWLGRRGHRWAVAAGMVCYALDSLLLVVFADWLGLAFHAWGLFGMSRAWKRMGALQKLDVAQASGDAATVQSLVLEAGVVPMPPPAEPLVVPRLLEPVSAKATLPAVLMEPLYWILIVPFAGLGLVLVMLATTDFSPGWVVLAGVFLCPVAFLLWVALTRRIEVSDQGVTYVEGARRLLFPWAELQAAKFERPLKQITFWTHNKARRIHEFGLPKDQLAAVREALVRQVAARRIPVR